MFGIDVTATIKKMIKAKFPRWAPRISNEKTETVHAHVNCVAISACQGPFRTHNEPTAKLFAASHRGQRWNLRLRPPAISNINGILQSQIAKKFSNVSHFGTNSINVNPLMSAHQNPLM